MKEEGMGGGSNGRGNGKRGNEIGPDHGERITWASQKIKIMFHVFQYGEGRGGEGGEWLEIFPSPKAYIGGGRRLPL